MNSFYYCSIVFGKTHFIISSNMRKKTTCVHIFMLRDWSEMCCSSEQRTPVSATDLENPSAKISSRCSPEALGRLDPESWLYSGVCIGSWIGYLGFIQWNYRLPGTAFLWLKCVALNSCVLSPGPDAKEF